MTEYINPYNFVPLGNGVKRTNQPSKGNLTGHINCSLKTLTPLCIPDSETGKADSNEHKTYDFFKVGGNYIIPGSQIRGVIRSIYETITESCYTSANLDELTLRSRDAGKPGIVKYFNDEWMLYEATKVNNASIVRKWEKQSQGQNPHNEIYYTRFTKGSELAQLNSDVISEYNQLVFLYGEYAKDRPAKESGRKVNDSAQERYKSYMIRDKEREYPVFYYKVGGIYHITPAQLSRRMYSKTLIDFLGTYAPCSDEGEGLCPACQLFGNASDGIATSSSVRFSDATAVGKPAYEKATLKILSSPHISALEFYFMLENQKQFNEINKWDYNTENLNMRGRKFYFHIPEAKTNDKIYSTNEKTKMNSTMELVKPGAEFSFKVYFNGITKEQLKDLLWSLTLGDNNSNDNYAHKIGHGKPLGLGSVKIKADKVFIRDFSLSGGYSYRKDENGDEGLDCGVFLKDSHLEGKELNQSVRNALMNMLKFDFVKGQNVAYPIGRKGKDENTMQWFVLNHLGGKTYHYVLAPATSTPESMKLPYLPDSKMSENNKSSSDNKNNKKDSDSRVKNNQRSSSTHGKNNQNGSQNNNQRQNGKEDYVDRVCKKCGKHFSGRSYWNFCQKCKYEK